MKNLNQSLLLLSFAGAVALSSTACSDLGDDVCAEDEVEVCTLDEDASAVEDCIDGSTDDGAACTCTCAVGDPDPDMNPAPNPDMNPDVMPDMNPEPDLSFRFVLVEDLTANPSGDFPGADIDAISVIKASGDEFFAETFEEDTDIDCTGNLACDVSALLGAPDAIDPETGFCFGKEEPVGADVDPTLFTALNGGFVIVQFSSVANGDVTIENGDDIHVFEVGNIECNSFDPDPFRVSVSLTDDIEGNFIEMGEANGRNIIPVIGL